MPQPKLQKQQGEPVPEWSLPLDKLRALRPAGLAPARAGAKLKRFPSPVPRDQLLIIPDRITSADLLRPDVSLARLICPPRTRVRKNQKNLSPVQWQRFIHAIEALAEDGMPSPTYDDFVDVHQRAMHPTDHTGHSWGAHTMNGHDGRNFLIWHREYLAKLEARLRAVNPLVTIPYWNWVEDRALPPEISDPADLAAWGVTRGSSFNGSLLPDAAWIASVMSTGVSPPNFTAFSVALESPHNTVHNLVGGTMQTRFSPADPVFWLHHAFIDKLWADWQIANAGSAFNPPNMTEALQPPPIMTRKVSQVVSTTALGYVYA